MTKEQIQTLEKLFKQNLEAYKEYLDTQEELNTALVYKMVEDK